MFVIGAMKAATSSLHSELARHPDIWMTPFKEPAFFLGPTESSHAPALSDQYRNSLQEYLSLFAGGATRQVRGESTTDYTKRPRFSGVAERIHQFEPQARFIYLLRDPVERTLSHYWWSVGHDGETREMLEAITEEPFYRDVSYYAWQLEPYLKQFAREQLLVQTTEAFSAQPERILKSAFAWLGVEPDARLAPSSARENVTPDKLAQTRSRMLQRLRHSSAGDLLTRVLPKRVRRLGHRLAEREVLRASTPVAEVYAFLRPIQRKQTEHLSDLMGRSFPEWRTLYGSQAG
jgi:hypothetical protein